MAGLKAPESDEELEKAAREIKNLMIMVDVVRGFDVRDLEPTVNVVDRVFEAEGRGIFTNQDLVDLSEEGKN